MSQTPKTYFLLLCLATFSFASFGQEIDSLKTSKKSLDRLELETSVSLFASQEFNSVPGGGFQLGVFAPFYNGGLRLGLSVGFSGQTFSYNFDWGQHRVLGPTPPYTSQLEVYPFNVDLTIGTDFLRKSSMDLILEVGGRMNVPLTGNYKFDYTFYNYPTDHSFQIQSSIHPAAIASLRFSFPLNGNSSLTFGYGFSYTFLPFRPKANSESNGFYYRPEEIPDNHDNNLEDNILSPVPNVGFSFTRMLVLELPNEIGGQHSISIGYRHTFGLTKKKE